MIAVGLVRIIARGISKKLTEVASKRCVAISYLKSWSYSVSQERWPNVSLKKTNLRATFLLVFKNTLSPVCIFFKLIGQGIVFRNRRIDYCPNAPFMIYQYLRIGLRGHRRRIIDDIVSKYTPIKTIYALRCSHPNKLLFIFYNIENEVIRKTIAGRIPLKP